MLTFQNIRYGTSFTIMVSTRSYKHRGMTASIPATVSCCWIWLSLVIHLAFFSTYSNVKIYRDQNIVDNVVACQKQMKALYFGPFSSNFFLPSEM